MKKQQKSMLSSTLIIINGIVILVFLLLSGMLIYMTATSFSEPGEEGQTYLYQQDEQPTLLFLEQRENYASGDTVLVRNELDGKTVYLKEDVVDNEDDYITVQSDGMEFQEDRSNIVGCVVFESPTLGKMIGYISAPENTVTVVIIAAAVFAVVVCLIVLTAVLIGRKKHTAEAEETEESFLENLFRIEEEESDFVKDVYEQEIREPVELSSAGDDKEPMSDEELKRFQETIMSGSGTK